MNLTIEKLLTPYNYSRSAAGDFRKIDYIVIHYFGDLATARNAAKYFASRYLGVSAHYCVDGGPVAYQCVEDKNIAWHCGTKGKVKINCFNSNSIGIEVAPQKINTKSRDVKDYDWYFEEQTLKNLIELTAFLMDKHNIDQDHVVRHFDVTGKWCPRPFVGEDINMATRLSGNSAWNLFKANLLSYKKEKTMDGKKIYEALMDYLRSLPASEYAKESCAKGITSGLFADGDQDGLVDDPRAFLTREQLAVVLNNAGLLDK